MNKETCTDSMGNEWEITIKPKDVNTKLSYRTLSDIDIEAMFSKFVSSQHSRVSEKMKAKTKHQGKQHTLAELQLLADVYNNAYANRVSVQEAVAEAFGIGISTASKRIMRAREYGLLKREA